MDDIPQVDAAPQALTAIVFTTFAITSTTIISTILADTLYVVMSCRIMAVLEKLDGRVRTWNFANNHSYYAILSMILPIILASRARWYPLC